MGRYMPSLGRWAVAALLAIGSLGLIPADADAQKGSIVIGSKASNEQIWMGEMMALLLEQAGFKVERKLGLGGSKVVGEAIVKGDIDAYPEYVVTGLRLHLGLPGINDPQKSYDEVKRAYKEKWGIEWLNLVGLDNKYVLVMRKDRARTLKVVKISDLARVKDEASIGGTHEFMNREDGLQGLQKVLKVKFANARGMDPGVIYTAVDQGKVDVGSGFATDGRIAAMDLLILEDDLQFFAPGLLAPIVRGEIIAKYPEVRAVLEKLGGMVDTVAAQKLNRQFDGEAKDARTIAATYLKEKGLLK